MNLLKNILFCIILLTSLIIALPINAIDTSTGDQESAAPEINQEIEKFGESAPVPTSDLPTFIGNIIKIVIGIIGVILIAMFVYGGITYATSAGSQEKTETGKKIMLYTLIGIIIIALAYVLTDFIINALFEFRKSSR